MDTPGLDGVKSEDKIMVQDVIRVVLALNKCSAWAVQVKGGAYEITAWLATDKGDIEVTLEELDLIQSVNQLRVKAGFMVFSATNKPALWIRVVSHGEPVMLQETTLERVRKRSRWWSLLSS